VRNELVLADLSTHSMRVLDRCAHPPVLEFNFSPDGRFLAYNWGPTTRVTNLRICRLEDGPILDITRPVLADNAPVFDPEGGYLYFIGAREFNPVYDKLHFDLGFPKGTRPYLVALRKDVPSPMGRKRDKPTDQSSNDAAEVSIDFDGIQDRIEALPVPEGIYQQIAALKGKVVLTSNPI